MVKGGCLISGILARGECKSMKSLGARWMEDALWHNNTQRMASGCRGGRTSGIVI